MVSQNSCPWKSRFYNRTKNFKHRFCSISSTCPKNLMTCEYNQIGLFKLYELPQEHGRVEIGAIVELSLQHISAPRHLAVPIVHIRNLKDLESAVVGAETKREVRLLLEASVPVINGEPGGYSEGMEEMQSGDDE
nr:hypothetical protein Iba_scaffold25934CG0010 [Ipomoea batatas]